jgi:insertion element IS1 protein InsB
MPMSVREAWPECGSQVFKKNGHIHKGKQNHPCKDCGRQFVVDAPHREIGAEQRTGVERLLCERISLPGICRAIGVSIGWLMDFLVARCAAVPADLPLPPVSSSREVLLGCLDAEAEELWSFVQKQATPQWVWLARDRQTRQILAFHIGDRSRDSAKHLWANIPERYRERAIFYPDPYAASIGVIPAAQHKPIGKDARKTNHIERFNNTLRQRVSRLVRSTLAFSKNMENHIGAIRYFICHYNLAKAALLV